MLLIPCPHCGPREEREFRCGGESHVARPSFAEAPDDEAFAEYLYVRTNPRGVQAERWHHLYGCRRWFNLLRDTVTHEIAAVYPMGAPRPESAP
ncbi:sarcosine oxidase subunit delta [Azospirillum sp. Vi22]|uniref:sarcosine oxidase subunit delta n=1 Tax=Azospirillum baldaniorum TaxID=1064539 RepID=UPI0011A3075D|nr:sarcosine oxidase subunit delta [Azospirillum baldaniorum]NUB09127.1 sarcosine oxidase subunit delta [Azospirillum baldaniorum]TWA65666.1 sarcosine oxidase subunit delta [Azospirillum baldaniorum]